MKKTFSLFVFALCVNLLMAQEVKITHNLPAMLSTNENFDVEFTITKGNVGSFAKFQCELPVGFNAVQVDNKGGNFTFENNRVKIVWVAVPAEPAFAFKFKITCPNTPMHTCVVGAKFYYLENNVKKEYEMPPHNMSITHPGEAGYHGDAAKTSSPTSSPSSSPTSSPSSSPTSSAPIASTPSSSPSSSPTSTPSSSPSSSPETTSTSPSETSSTTISTTPTSSPSVNEASTTSTSPTTTSSTPVNTSSTSSTSANTTPSVTPSSSTYTPPSTTTSNSAAKTSTSSSGKTFKVQVGAFSSRPDKSKLSSYGSVQIVEEGGMYKALMGNFKNLEDAEKYKADLIGKGLSGAFVVAYQNGARVSVR